MNAPALAVGGAIGVRGAPAAPPRADGSAAAVRPPEHFGLPPGYRQQTVAFSHDDTPLAGAGGEPAEYWNPDRVRASARYQHHVYRWAAELCRPRGREVGARSVLDVGCGPATKLRALVAPVCPDVEGIDQPSGVRAAERAGGPGRFTAVDLERCGGVAPWRTFDLIVCADVVEHLLDPDPMMGLIRRFCHAGSLVLLSTPDRARLRGRACMASDKPEHVREWAAGEFVAFVRSRGFAVERARPLPAADEPRRRGIAREWMFRLGLAGTSPHRCLAVLCRPAS